MALTRVIYLAVLNDINAQLANISYSRHGLLNADTNKPGDLITLTLNLLVELAISWSKSMQTCVTWN